MGGMIAQVMALRYPERVLGLILGCTHCGGDRAVRPSEEVLEIFRSYIMTGSQEAAQAAARCLFAQETLRKRPEVVQRYQDVTRRFPPDPRMLIHQIEAVQGHDTWAELPGLKVPTLVLAGTEDALVPPENATILCERIPHARMKQITGGGHQFLVERPEAFNRAVMEFLQSVDFEKQTSTGHPHAASERGQGVTEA
jgi:pimeloyl-ACP methyl ester carboxylesterase